MFVNLNKTEVKQFKYKMKIRKKVRNVVLKIRNVALAHNRNKFRVKQ